jgi:hypothetical protein
MGRQKKDCTGLETSSPSPNEGNNVQLSLFEINPFNHPLWGTTSSSIGVSMNIEILLIKIGIEWNPY